MPGPQLCRRCPFSSSSAGRRGRRPLRWQPVDFPVAASAHGGRRAGRKQLDKPKRDRLFQTVSLLFVVLSCRIIRIKVRQNPLAALAGVRHADGVAQGQNGARRDGELVHAEGEEGLGQGQVCAQLTADADPDAVLVGVLGHKADQAQHRGVMRVVEAAQVVVLTVTGQRVLGQIVRADAEEVGLL